jgi:hypothetical protein
VRRRTGEERMLPDTCICETPTISAWSGPPQSAVTPVASCALNFHQP